MTVYAVEDDPSILRKPVTAFLRVIAHRKTYFLAWWISCLSIFLSFLGLLGFGVGFFFTSVWAWDVAGYSFTLALYSERNSSL